MEEKKIEKLNPEVEILNPDQWEELKDFRLFALKTDPIAFGESYDREEKKTEQEIREKLGDLNYKAYVIKIGDKVRALATCNLYLPGRVTHQAQIHAVFTDPDYRKQGLGKNLLEKILKDLHQNPITSRVSLSVSTTQEGAIKMYEKAGFKEFGIGHKELKVDGKYYDLVYMELIFEDKL
ncbi:MAG: hypothetical protein QG583_71 [Patescibacteria group bacterium]|nr:hypothetical protein [Patescibacteria group bacterium]